MRMFDFRCLRYYVCIKNTQSKILPPTISSGQSRVLNDHHQRGLASMIYSTRQVTLARIPSTFNIGGTRRISSKSVQAPYWRRQLTRVPLLILRNRTQHLTWARKSRHLDPGGLALFDESTCQLFPVDGSVWDGRIQSADSSYQVCCGCAHPEWFVSAGSPKHAIDRWQLPCTALWPFARIHRLHGPQ